MAGAVTAPPPEPKRLPGEAQLPYEDGIPMEDYEHVLQLNLLDETLRQYWPEHRGLHIGGNQFLYFSEEQIRGRDFRGPDCFIVVDVPRRTRKSWVVWEEGKPPDVVFEFLSRSTARFDRTDKKRIYQDEVKVPEYFLFRHETGELVGFSRVDEVYRSLVPDARGRLVSSILGLCVVRWTGVYGGTHGHWVRWETVEGLLLPTHAERADAERQIAEAERQKTERLEAQLRALGIDPEA